MIPVIISGGSGTRLWPKSRSSFPKQFADLMDESLEIKTIKRLKTLGEPWILTTKELETLTSLALKQEQISVTNAIYEPFGQNTAPAVALLCKVFLDQKKQDKVVGIFPADHFIENEKAFLQAVKLGEEFAEKDQVVTLGIKPHYPATGYGYIEVDINQFQISSSNKLKVYKTKKFTEKPNIETAVKFLKQGNFFWNAGMFIFKISVMVEQIQRFMPETWRELQKLKPDFSNISEIYKNLKNESIDYAVMEKLPEQVCVPCEMGWNDLGCWDEVLKYQNKIHQVIESNATNNSVVGKPNKVYAFTDVSDSVIIDTEDALLITKKDHTQNVKNLTDVLKKQNPKILKEHVFEYRPWGYFEILRDTEDFKSKILRVNPGQRLSYQSHQKRAEHWIVIKGNPEVTLDDKVINLKAGEHVFIPQGAKHRISNPTDQMVEIVEVQVGTYFGEDDITRYQDDYKRST